MRVCWAQTAMVVLIAGAGTGGCVLFPDDAGSDAGTDDGAGDGTGVGSDDLGDEASGGTSDDDSVDETGAELVCEPQPDVSCADAGAPSVRGLDGDEWLGVSTRTSTDLVLGATSVSREAPRPEHPGYLFVLLYTDAIHAELSEQTHAELAELAAAVPDSIGVHGSGWDATIRIGDAQACVDVSAGCEAHDALLESVAELDDALLSAWWDENEGLLHPIDTIEVEPWPLRESWGDGGEIEVTQELWESLDHTWFVDEAGVTAHVGRHCYGSGDGCHTWLLDVSILQREPSPLSDEQHATLLKLMPWGPVGFGVPLAGADFDALRNAHVLDFEDPQDPTVHHTVTVVARPSLAVDAAF